MVPIHDAEIAEALSGHEDHDVTIQQLLEHHQAAAIAMAVHDEVEAMQWEQEQEQRQQASRSSWKDQGAALLRQIPLLRAQLAVAPGRRQCVEWQLGEECDLTSAPWGLLLDPRMPLGADHPSPADMLRLRGVSSAFRAHLSTGQFFAKILERFGVTVRSHCHPPRKLFELSSRIFAELSFVHTCRAVAARAVGMRSDAAAASDLCHVAGSYAVRRALQLDPALQGTAHSMEWTPGDIDVFVGCFGDAWSERSRKLFAAIVSHAKAACFPLYRHATNLELSFLPISLEGRMQVEPHVLHARSYGTEPHMVDGGSTATALSRGHGLSYPRRAVLELVTGDTMMTSPTHVRELARAAGPRMRLADAVAQLPETLGSEGLYHVEHVAEVNPFRSYERAACSHSSWPMPMRINIIQYSCRSGKPLPSLPLLAGFDLCPAMVEMIVDRELRTRFVMSDETRECLRERKLKLSKYAFGPASKVRVEGSDGNTVPDEVAMNLGIEDAVVRQLERMCKYRRYGFEL